MNKTKGIVWFAIRLGIASILSGHYKIGLKRLLYPVGYWRYPVFRYAISCLRGRNNLKVLDIGSPKLLALWIALQEKNIVYATDIQDQAIFDMWDIYYKDYIKHLDWRIPSQYYTEFQDARNLKYEDNTFDVVYSISVLEHIPDQGDIEAMKEIYRVLKKGGIAIIEIPYAVEARDTFLDIDVYNREYSGSPVFYQRHYNEKDISGRIIKPSGMQVLQRKILGERLPFEKYWSTIPELFKALFYWVEWPLSIINLYDVENKLMRCPGKYINTAMDITIIFKKS